MEEEIQNEEVVSTKRKSKSVRRIKKEHKETKKEEKKKVKKLSKKQKHIAKKFGEKQLTKVPSDVFSDAFVDGEPNEFEKKSIDVSSGKTKQEKVLIVRKTKEPVTRKRKILNLLSYALVGIFALGFGYVAGNFYFANYMNKPNYNFNTAELKYTDAEKEEIYNRISTKAIATQNPIEIIAGAEYLLSQQQKYIGNVVGSVKPSISSAQTVRGVKGRDGNHFYVENYSKGILPIAEKYDYYSDTDTALVYRVEGKGVSIDSANFKDTPTWTFNKESFSEEYGISPTGMIIPYIISPQTVISGTETIESVGDGKYRVSMQLLKDKSVVEYVKQVKHMSGFSDYPNFKSVRVSFVLDSSYRILSVRYDETYSVIYGLVVDCVAWLSIDISYD